VTAHHLQWALLPDGLTQHVRVDVEGDTIVALGDSDPEQERPGVTLPGLINAHVHLDLAGPRLAANGLADWVRRLPRPTSGAKRYWKAVSFGTAAVVEVSNALMTAEVLAQSGMAHVVHHEVLGIDVQTLPQTGGTRPSPHAPYSTSAALIQQAAAVPGPMATIHCDEDPAERDFLATGEGDWARFIADIGRDLGTFRPPGCTPVPYLDRLGVLNDRIALVHCTLTRDEDLDLIAERGATVVLCPRSNLHIHGALPDVRGLVERDIPLALGTDSLASCDDLDLMKDVAVLTEAFPDLAQVFLQAATAGGARVLGREDMGRIAVGARPGLWNGRWVLPPGGAAC
jgi:aminodeoxyfutalosine deaminase